MMRILAFIIILLMFSKNLIANEQIVLGLSQDEVAITANFDGSKILLFGAIQRDAPQPDGKMGVIITVCLLYTSPSPRDERLSRMPSSA